MYIGTLPLAQLSPTDPNGVVALLVQQGGFVGWLEQVLWATWVFIIRIVNAFVTWLLDVAPSLNLWLFKTPAAWTVEVFYNAIRFLHAHPHPVHIICWSIFFGPIIILLPALLLLEIVILVLFNLSFITHGMLPGSLEDKYDSLKDYFMDSRESLFASVESYTAIFNKWTVDYPPLLVARLAAGAMGLFVLFGIWSGW